MKYWTCSIIFLLLIVGGTISIRSGFPSFTNDQFLPAFTTHTSEPVEFHGVMAQQVLHWDFRQGLFPGGWGWGDDDWSLVDAGLEGHHAAGRNISAYFYNLECGREFVLETRIRFLRGEEGVDAKAQLLVRDSNRMGNESGMVLYAGTNQVALRHMVQGTEYVYDLFEMPFTIEYGQWYLMRFMLHNRRISASVDNIPVPYDAPRFPLGLYREPHLAMESGVAEFESVTIYAITSRGGWRR
jgi:hypothetical protein